MLPNDIPGSIIHWITEKDMSKILEFFEVIKLKRSQSRPHLI